MGVNLIGLGSGGFAQLIGTFRVHGIDRDARFQQEGDEQSMVRFDNAHQVFRRSCNAQQKLFQLVQAVVTVGKAPCSDALARFIQHHYIMVGVCPIQTNVPHSRTSFLHKLLGASGPYITGARSTSLQSSIGPGKLPEEERSFHTGRAVWRKKSFPGSVSGTGINPVDPSFKGSGKILTYKEEIGANVWNGWPLSTRIRARSRLLHVHVVNS